MDAKTLAKLHEQFRKIADDKVAVDKLADDTAKANPDDDELADVLAQYKGAKDGNAVRQIADNTK